jgi:hypothetical protein
MMLQPVVAYPPYSAPHPHQRLHHHHPPPPQQQQQHQQHHHHHLLHPQQHPLHHDIYAPQPQYSTPLLLAPAYRPQYSSPVVAPVQQQQLALAQQQATTPAFPPQASVPDPGLQIHHHHNHTHSQHPVAAYTQQRRDRSQQPSMAFQPSEEEMAEMQRLSAAYESEAMVCIVDAGVVAARVCNSLSANAIHAP